MRLFILCLLTFAIDGAAETKFPLDPLPKIPVAEMRAMMKAACSGKFTVTAEKFYSCSSCPEEGESWGAGAVRFGHFLRADAQNALIEMIGCGLGGANKYGKKAAATMLEKKAGLWTNVAYFSSGTDENCRAIARPDRRELLFCQSDEMFHGEMHQWLSVIDFASSSYKGQLVHFTDTGLVGCAYPAYRIEGFDRVSFADRNGDGLADITIYASKFSGAYTGEERDSCSEHAGDPPKASKTETFELIFLFDGVRFQPSPETVIRLERLSA